jgi:peptidase E
MAAVQGSGKACLAATCTNNFFRKFNLHLFTSKKEIIMKFFSIKTFSILAVLLLYVGTSAYAQAKIYKGSSSSSFDQLYTVKDGKVYKGSSSSSFDQVYNIRDNKIYKGSSYSSFDQLFNIKDGKIYKGSSSSSCDMVCNIKDGKVYRGSSSSSFDMICNIKNGKVYKGSSNSSFDIMMSYTESNEANILFLLAILNQ